jgi:hypothetical protein
MTHNFKITIDDQYSAYTYEYNLPDDVSIYDIAQVVAKKYNVALAEGQFETKDPADQLLFSFAG